MSSLDKNIHNKLKYYMTPLKTVEESDEFLLKKITGLTKRPKYEKLKLNLAKINIIPDKDSLDNSINKTLFNNHNKSFSKDSKIKLPILDMKNASPYIKMKQYKVSFPKNRIKKEISQEEQEEKIQKLLNKYAKTNFKFNKYLIGDNMSKKYDFNRYLKLQSEADIKFKPRYGDSSTLLVNYINKVSEIRKKIVEDILDDISKNTENRYNNEKPKVDFVFSSRDKTLVDNRWKNTFSLNEYQKYFAKNLKGKISDMSYLDMVKKFQKISLICFSEGNLNRAAMKKLDYIN